MVALLELCDTRPCVPRALRNQARAAPQKGYRPRAIARPPTDAATIAAIAITPPTIAIEICLSIAYALTQAAGSAEA